MESMDRFCFFLHILIIILYVSFHSVEREFEVRDLALARLEGEKERGGEVQVRYSGSGNILIRI